MPWACSLQQACTASVSPHEGLSSSVGALVLACDIGALSGGHFHHCHSKEPGAQETALQNRSTVTASHA